MCIIYIDVNISLMLSWYRKEAGFFISRFRIRKGVKAVAISKAQQKAVRKYKENNYDRVELSVTKGKKDVIKAHASAQGESLNAFINRAIDETMKRDAGE